MELRIFCVRVNQKKYLITICDKHLKVAVIGLFDISCSSNQEIDFVFDLSEKQKRFSEGCVRHYCQEMIAFFNFCNFNVQ